MGWRGAAVRQLSMCQSISRHVSLWFLALVTLMLSCSSWTFQNGSARTLGSMCGLDDDWHCKQRNIEKVPLGVMEVCEACGSYWWNVPGLAFCCRCSEMVFGFCLEAVYGTGR